MFGYVTVNPQELKVKDYTIYRSYYCGLCHTLKSRYGRKGQMLLNYDMTFLSILLTGLYEPAEEERKGRCIPHPAVSHKEIESEITEYAADMTVLLAYQKAVDDWHDDHSHPKRALACMLYKDYKKIRSRYPRQAKTLERCVRELSEAERAGNTDVDYVAGLTGQFLAEMFVWKDDIWQEDLRQLGFFLGKFIYLVDAFDDMEADRKAGSYNLFLKFQEENPDGFEQQAENLLVELMSYSARSFERLPILKRADILRNVLYSGVWMKYAQVRDKRAGKKEEADEKSL